MTAPAPVIPHAWEMRGEIGHDRETWRTIDECWRAGDLTYLLDETQLEIYWFIRNNPSKTIFVDAARQLGKSFVDVVIGLEDGIRNPGKRVNYVAKTFGSLKKMMEQTMEVIACQAPEELRPTFDTTDSRWEFPKDGPARGAFIQLVGADETRGADRCRGGSVITNIVDEAGFIDCLEYLLVSVIKPMGRRTRAVTILSTSPAFSPDHYSCEVQDACIRNGANITRDYWSPGMQSQEEKLQYVRDEAAAAGKTVEEFMATTAFRREYLCERVLETELAVVPEWPSVKTRVLEAGLAAQRPPWWDLYVAGDPGMDDLTGILFAVCDFRRSRLVIEHELLLTKANTQTIADAMGEVMKEHYPAPEDDLRSVKFKKLRLVGKDDFAFVVKPYRAAFDDTHKRLSADFYEYHGLQLTPADNSDREASINAVRLELSGLHIEIHPRCVNLVRQLGTAVRTKPGGDMARSKKDGHYDLIAALRILVRLWDKAHNPYPPDWNFDPKTMVRREQKPRRSLQEYFNSKR